MAKTITVPKTPRSAYNPKRAASSLLTAHVANLEAATRRHVHARPSRKPRTEAQAARYIAELTQELHPHAHPPAGAPPPLPAVHGLAVMPAKKRARASVAATGSTKRKGGKPIRKRNRMGWRKK
jgi:hypothetical protein